MKMKKDTKSTVKQANQSKLQTNAARNLADPENNQENKAWIDTFFPNSKLIQNCCVLLSHLKEQSEEA
ncbi:MAG: hypothetical protein ACOX1X_04240 [Dethiobacteria bacterium]|jgi:hypothetical protein